MKSITTIGKLTAFTLTILAIIMLSIIFLPIPSKMKTEKQAYRIDASSGECDSYRISIDLNIHRYLIRQDTVRGKIRVSSSCGSTVNKAVLDISFSDTILYRLPSDNEQTVSYIVASYYDAQFNQFNIASLDWNDEYLVLSIDKHGEYAAPANSLHDAEVIWNQFN